MQHPQMHAMKAMPPNLAEGFQPVFRMPRSLRSEARQFPAARPGEANPLLNLESIARPLVDRPFARPLALQLLFLSGSESMGNHDSNIVDAGSVD